MMCRFLSTLTLTVLFSVSATAAEFKPQANIDNLIKVSWRNGEAKLALRNDWIASFLTIALNQTIRDSPDIKRGDGQVRIVDQNPGDSIVTLGFDFDVVPDRTWFDPHVRCEGKIRIAFPQTALARAEIRILDREPIDRCKVSGEIGNALDLGRLVKERLNERISNMPEQNFLLLIGRALFGNEELQDRMTRMYLLQELVPVATMGMDDCTADAELNMPMGDSICLTLKWPAARFESAVAHILREHPAPQPTNELISEARIQQWRDISPVCLNRGTPYPSKGDCDTGDMTLFAGLLCLSGEEAGCQMVRDSQDSQGRWWRSPQRLGREGENFSPDMFLGVVAYLNQTQDAARLQNWVQYILRQPRTIPNVAGPQLTLFQTCPDGADGVCNALGSEWYWLQKMRAWAPSLGSMPDYGHDSSWLIVEALANERGFRLHLVAIQVLMQKMFGERDDANVSLAARILAAREPQNPFFVYLSMGRDQRVLNLMRQQCPAIGQRPAQQNQWSWERKFEEGAYRNSMGWDCVFMANLWNDKIGL